MYICAFIFYATLFFFENNYDEGAYNWKTIDLDSGLCKNVRVRVDC